MLDWMKFVYHLCKRIFLIPHIILFYTSNKSTRELICSDIEVMNSKLKIRKGFVYYLSKYKYYRNLFYYRLGRKSSFIKWLLPGSNLLIIGSGSIGRGCYILNHPYSTILNAKKIGDNFIVRQCTTIGNKIDGRNDLVPTIGNNVNLGANVVIIGGIKIGNNVIVGAGSVVVKADPDNCIIAGNPASIIKYTI